MLYIYATLGHELNTCNDSCRQFIVHLTSEAVFGVSEDETRERVSGPRNPLSFVAMFKIEKQRFPFLATITLQQSENVCNKKVKL